MIGIWCRLITDLFFPRTCTVCGRTLHLREKHLCLSCYAGLPLTYFWELKDNPAEQVFWGRAPLHRVYTLFYYVNEYRTPLHRLKYNNQGDIGLYLGELLGQKIAQDPHRGVQPIDYLVPVPLHYRKKWKRGYNQAEIIAKGVLRGLPGAPPRLLPHLLKRRQFTQTQTEKNRIDRWKSVSTAFRINEKVAKKLLKDTQGITLSAPEHPRPLHLLLVDDVLTTGATLDACAQLLQQQLGCTVSIATLAYVE